MFKNSKQNIVWGGLLILFGILSFLEMNMDFGTWVWVWILAAASVAVLGVYLTDRSEVSILIMAYALFAIAFMIALVDWRIIRDEAIATYVLTAIAIPFVLGYYQTGRTNWGLLIPAYVLTAVGVMVGLIGLGVLRNLLIPAYILLAISLPFFVAYYRDRSNGALLIPGGITAFIGVSFLMASAAEYIAPVVLIGVGAWILFRQFKPKEALDG